MRLWLLVFVVVSFLAACHSLNNSNQSYSGNTRAPTDKARMADNAMEQHQQPRYKPGEVLVKFKPHVTKGAVEAIARECQLEIVKIVAPPDLYLMRTRGTVSVEGAVARLEKLEQVEYAEPNYILRIN